MARLVAQPPPSPGDRSGARRGLTRHGSQHRTLSLCTSTHAVGSTVESLCSHETMHPMTQQKGKTRGSQIPKVPLRRPNDAAYFGASTQSPRAPVRP